MKDDVCKVETDRSCEAFEELASRVCDGECSADEASALKAHLASCPSCRETFRAFMDIRDAVAVHCAAADFSPPQIQRRKPRHSASFWLKLGGIAACLLLAFAAGHVVGSRSAASYIAAYLSPMTVATPSMWSASKADRLAPLSDVESELPFTEGIKRYRSAITDELRTGRVDWNRVRTLLEAMGELRTDLELLTIHMAFLDINTGSSPVDVAERWDSLAGVDTFAARGDM